MGKIKEFLNSYKKIFIVVFAILAVILLFIGLCNLFFYRASIKSNNDVQLSRIDDKYIEMSEKYTQIQDVVSDINSKDALVMSRLLTLEPKDVNDKTYLNNCVMLMKNTNGIIILNRDRKVVNKSGTVRDIDYAEPYYDALFASASGKAVVVNDKGNNSMYSICVATDSYFVVIQKDNTLTDVLDTTEESLWKMALHSVGLNSSSYFAAVSTNDGTVIYSDYDNFTGRTLLTEEKSWNYYEIDGHDYYIQTCNGSEGIRLLALTPRDKIIQRCSLNFKLATAIVISVFLILIAYIICLKQDETDNKLEYLAFGKYFLKNQTGRYKSLTVLVLVVMTVVFLVVSVLNNNSFTMEHLKRETDSCKETVEAVSDIYEKASKTKDMAMYGYAGIAGEFLSLHSEYATKEGMKKLSKALDVESITLFCADGSTLCTSSPMDHINIMDDEDSSLYELRYVLMGKEGVSVCGDSKRISADKYIYAVPRRRFDGVANGAIALITLGGVSNSVYQALEDAVYTIFHAKTNLGKPFIVDKNGVIVATVKINEKVNIKKLAETSLKDGYLGTLKIDKINYIASVTYLESYDWYLYVVMPANQFSNDTLLNYAVLFVMLILMALCMWYEGLGSKQHFDELKQNFKDDGNCGQDNSKYTNISVGKKMGRILSVYIYIFSVFLIMTKILQRGEIIPNVGATYIVSGLWEKTVSGYSILGNICLIFVFYTVIRFIEFLIKKVETFIGNDSATLCRLISSLVSYVGVLICLYKVVSNFGVDAAAALASIGIIGFALTFGAQELIKDMISGLFILFEGRFKVGDLIDINDNWYWIKSIGVRTTVVGDKYGNVRVINNSKMTGIVNIQNAMHPVNIDFLLDSKYKTDEIRAIFIEELPAMKAALPAVAMEPTWKGVQDINGSGTLFRIRTYCPPIRRGKVGRAMRGELKRILDKHGINVASESIVVNNINT